jgi:xanthine dehydrogenase large subunit
MSRGDTAQRSSGVVGQDVAHDSAVTHVSGESVFLDDVTPLSGELVAGIMPCPVAHGRLRSVDTRAACLLPGVEAILTAKDIRGHNRFGPVVKDEDLLVESEAVFLGQPVAIIAARNTETLEAARKAVVVECEALPAIFTIDQAIEAGTFLGGVRQMSRGDLDAGFAEADQLLDGELEIGGQEHFYLESQIAIAVPGEQGSMTIHSSTQHPSEVQAMVAEVLGVPFNQVTCECKRMGGGFGGKETQAAQPAMYAALLAAHTRRPVRFAYNKDDDMAYTGKRHPFKTVYRVGFKTDGRLTALQLKLYANGGCSTDLSFAVLERAMLHSDNAYYLPNVHIEGRVCKTNLPSNTAFRGFGGPQGVAGIENVMQEIALALGMDAMDVRRVNLYGVIARNVTHYGQRVTLPAASLGPTTPATVRQLHDSHPSLEREEDANRVMQNLPLPVGEDGAHGKPWRGVIKPAPVVPPFEAEGAQTHGNTLHVLLETLRHESAYDRRREEITTFNRTSKTHLRGLALSMVKFGISFTRRTLNQANALVNIYTDGSVLVTTGATEMGQGVHTRVRQIVADALGVPYDFVRVGATSTDKNNNTSPTAASSGTDLNGAAALDACERVQRRLKDVLAWAVFSDASHGVSPSPDSICFANGFVWDARVPQSRIPWAKAVAVAYEQRVSLGERGFYATPGVDFNRDTGKGTPFLYFTNGAACSEVLIDRFTGEMSVPRVDLIMDAGKSINPGIDRGQVVGGFIQGMGWVTTEELVYKADGTLLSHSPTTYKIPNVSDTPRQFNVRFLDNPHNVVSVHRSKAVGEPPLLLGASVWLAAKDALSSVVGSRANRLAIPATGERLIGVLYDIPAPVNAVEGETPPRRTSSPNSGG